MRSFIDRLEQAGELVRITAPVDPVLEIAEITDRVSKSSDGGKALLFENPTHGRLELYNYPVATNLFGSPKRIAIALGASSLDEISARLDGVLRAALEPRSSLAQKIKALPMLARMSRWFPRKTCLKNPLKSSCQEEILDGGLEKLPILKCWPHDGGRFLTLPLVHTVDPETGAQNVGMYRMQVLDSHTTGMHWHCHKTGARHYESYKRLGIERMPVSVCLGGDPAYTYAATAPMPEGMDEYLLAGFLRRRPVKLVKCCTNAIYVPADCDFVIEGYVDTTEPLRTEGPFGDHTGFYSLEDEYPTFHIEKITHRKGAIFPATVVGVPPMEDAWFAAATERIFLPPIRRVLQPEIRDIHMPVAGVAHNLAIVSIEGSYAGQAEKTASALWGAGQMMFCKVLVVVPSDVDVRDYEAILKLLQGLDPARDLHFSHGVADVLDHAVATRGMSSKLLINLTYPPLPHSAPPVFNFIFDPAASALSSAEKLWLWLANIDPARDIKIEGNKITVDCRAKSVPTNETPPCWPNVIAMDEATVSKVDERWAEYGLGEPIASPSEKYRPLILSDRADV